VDGRYVTFVNPRPEKGAAVFARIARELGQRRPDVPLLVVEGRARAADLRRYGLDLDAADNLHVMANTPDPRDFYRVSRLVLVPSLWPESFARVVAEAAANGIPALASRRGGLPETLTGCGFLLDVPVRCVADHGQVPTAEEVAPWLDLIVRLWDNSASYDEQRRRCLTAAEAWRPESLVPRYEEFFADVLRPAVT
jgi:glycosyltransferase involved in cell wall biosynthesis